MIQEDTTEWRELPPEELPRSTLTPFFAALGITFLFWGLISSPVMIFVGLTLLILTLARWISTITSNQQSNER